MDFKIPRDVQGTAETTLICTPQVAEYFKFDELARWWAENSTLPAPNPLRGVRARQPNTTKGYRIVTVDKYPGGAAFEPRFSLPKSAPQKTLEVIARHLDHHRIGWLHFRASDGSKFRARRLQAYANHRAA